MRKFRPFLLFTLLALPLAATAAAGVVGDINNDGKIDLQEAIYALQVAANVYPSLDPSVVLVGKGAWSSEEVYITGDVVAFGDDHYACTADHTAASGINEPPDAGFWTLLTLEGEPGPIAGTDKQIIYNDNANSAGAEVYYDKSSGNLGIGKDSPAARLDVDGQIIRQVERASGLGPADGQDNGFIASRVMAVHKKLSDTALRIHYTDNFRVHGSNSCACRWEIKVDNASCPGGALVYDYYESNPSNSYSHHSATVTGFCDGITAGVHEIQIHVDVTPGFSGCDCHTGWNQSRWTISAEEIY